MAMYRNLMLRQPQKSHTKAWIVAMLGVPVLYLLSVPPLIIGTLSATATHNEEEASPRWAKLYGGPYDWLAGNTPLRKPLSGYADWCLKVMER
jgi:hypothetical protein